MSRTAAASWTAIVAHRRREVRTILPMTLLAAGAAVVWLGPARAGLWLGMVIGLIAVGAGVLAWIDSRRAPQPHHEMILAGWTAFYTALYCILPLQLMATGSPTAIVAACAMMGAIAISSTAEFVISRLISSAALTSMAAMSMLAIAQAADLHYLLRASLAGLSVLCFFCYVLRFALARARGEQALAQSLETAREKEAEAAAANAAKSVFLATMSHEIRTPLNGVLGMAGVMEMGELSAIQRQRLGVIRQSGEALTSILNDVLDLSKIEAGKLQLELIEFDLAELLRSAATPFAMLAREKGLTLTLDIAPEAQGAYIGDPTRLRQVIFNLVSNAVKFTETGGIAIHAARKAHVGEHTWGSQMGGEGQLIIAVADTGMGIPAGKAEQLFAKFTQGDPSTTRQHGGTGLGLSICRELCALMNGDITASSRVGQGATFTLALPLPKVITLPALGAPRGAGPAEPEHAVWDLTELAAPSAPIPPLHGEGVERAERCETGGASDPPPPTPQAQAPVAATLEPLPLRILAAEDNPTNQHVLRAILATAGVAPLIVDNGAEAIDAWSVGDFDLILMDIQMPVLDGAQALKEIRRREFATGRMRTPIIALTANAMSHQVQGLLADGFDAHVSKPIEVAGLFGAMERVLAGAAPTPARQAAVG